MSGSAPPDGDDPDERAEGEPKPGKRQDRKSYKTGNTRHDGSYTTGKYRPPEHGKFKTGDGRKRGQREKGSKNVATIWQKHLNGKITINGETRSAAEWLILSTIRRGITRSDRAAETAIAAAERLDQARERKLGIADQELLAIWLKQRLSEDVGEITDDANEASDTDNGNIPASEDNSDADQG